MQIMTQRGCQVVSVVFCVKSADGVKGITKGLHDHALVIRYEELLI